MDSDGLNVGTMESVIWLVDRSVLARRCTEPASPFGDSSSRFNALSLAAFLKRPLSVLLEIKVDADGVRKC